MESTFVISWCIAYKNLTADLSNRSFDHTTPWTTLQLRTKGLASILTSTSAIGIHLIAPTFAEVGGIIKHIPFIQNSSEQKALKLTGKTS